MINYTVEPTHFTPYHRVCDVCDQRLIKVEFLRIRIWGHTPQLFLCMRRPPREGTATFTQLLILLLSAIYSHSYSHSYSYSYSYSYSFAHYSHFYSFTHLLLYSLPHLLTTHTFTYLLALLARVLPDCDISNCARNEKLD
jgi:hypothetical protein